MTIKKRYLTKEYNKFRNRLLAMFYSDIVNKIGGEEVVL